MQRQLLCGHTDRQRYLFGSLPLSCAPCVLSALDVFSTEQARQEYAVDMAVILLSAIPRLLDVVSQSSSDRLLLPALLERSLCLCVSPLLFSLPRDHSALVAHTLPLVVTNLCKESCPEVYDRLSPGAEGWAAAAVLALRCSPHPAQTAASLSLMQHMLSAPSFLSACTRQEQIWDALLCLIRGGDRKAATLFLSLGHSLFPVGSCLSWTLHCNATSAGHSALSFADKMISPLIEDLLRYLCEHPRNRVPPGGDEDSARPLLLLQACLGYIYTLCPHTHCDVLPSDGSPFILLSIRRITRTAERLGALILNALGIPGTSTAQHPNVGTDHSILPPIGLHIVVLLLSLAQAGKDISDNVTPGGKRGVVNEGLELAEVFMKRTDLFMRVSALFATFTVKGGVRMVESMRGCDNENSSAVMGCCEGYRQYEKGMCGGVLSCSSSCVSGGPTCRFTQLSCVRIMRLLICDTSAAMHVCHYSKLTPALLTLILAVIKSGPSCVSVLLLDLLCALTRMCSQHDAAISKACMDYALLFPYHATATVPLITEAQLVTIECSPLAHRFNMCVCMSPRNNLLVLARVVELIQQLSLKMLPSAASTPAGQQGDQSVCASFRMVARRLFTSCSVLVAVKYTTYPLGLLSFLESVLRLCTASGDAIRLIDAETLLSASEEGGDDAHVSLARVLAFVSSHEVMSTDRHGGLHDSCSDMDRKARLFDATVLFVHSILQQTYSPGSDAIKCRNEQLSKFVFLDVASSRSLHKALAKGWMCSDADSHTAMAYGHLLYCLFHNSGSVDDEDKSVWADRADVSSVFIELLCDLSVCHKVARGGTSVASLLSSLHQWMAQKISNLEIECHTTGAIRVLYLYMVSCLDPLAGLLSLHEACYPCRPCDLSFVLELATIVDVMAAVTSIQRLDSPARLVSITSVCTSPAAMPCAAVLAVLLRDCALLEKATTHAVDCLCTIDATLLARFFALAPTRSIDSDCAHGLNVLVEQAVEVLEEAVARGTDHMSPHLPPSDEYKDRIRCYVTTVDVAVSILLYALMSALKNKDTVRVTLILHRLYSAGSTFAAVVSTHRNFVRRSPECAHARRVVSRAVNSLLCALWLLLIEHCRNTNKKAIERLNEHQSLWSFLQKSYGVLSNSLGLNSVPSGWHLCFQASTLLLLEWFEEDLTHRWRACDHDMCAAEGLLQEHIDWFYTHMPTLHSYTTVYVIATQFQVRTHLHSHSKMGREGLSQGLWTVICKPDVEHLQSFMVHSLLAALSPVLSAMCVQSLADNDDCLLQCSAGCMALCILISYASYNAITADSALLTLLDVCYIRCLELIVATSHVNMMSPATYSTSSDGGISEQINRISVKDRLILLVKRSALRACSAALQFADRNGTALDIGQWSEDVGAFLLSSPMWEIAPESKLFAQSLSNYRQIGEEKMSSRYNPSYTDDILHVQYNSYEGVMSDWRALGRTLNPVCLSCYGSSEHDVSNISITGGMCVHMQVQTSVPLLEKIYEDICCDRDASSAYAMATFATTY